MTTPPTTLKKHFKAHDLVPRTRVLRKYVCFSIRLSISGYCQSLVAELFSSNAPLCFGRVDLHASLSVVQACGLWAGSSVWCDSCRQMRVQGSRSCDITTLTASIPFPRPKGVTHRHCLCSPHFTTRPFVHLCDGSTHWVTWTGSIWQVVDFQVT